jgi:hypothetical protein
MDSTSEASPTEREKWERCYALLGWPLYPNDVRGVTRELRDAILALAEAKERAERALRDEIAKRQDAELERSIEEDRNAD